MYKGQKSVRGGVQDFLCPFTDMYITQGSNGGYSHKGIMANDVRGANVGERYPYYAPCDVKCIKIYPDSGQSMWQSINPVRCANGNVTYVTFMIAHDNSQDCYVGQVVPQGNQLGNMGDKPQNVCTGVHCHIQTEQGDDTSWYKNEYGIYQFNNEVDLDDMYFVDNTNIIDGKGGNWKTTSDVPVEDSQPSEYPLYKCLGDMYVRNGPSYKAGVKLVKDLTEDGKKNATSSDPNAYAVYKAGTIFTCYEKCDKGYGIWALTPSGYVCLVGQSGTVYCEEVKD